MSFINELKRRNVLRVGAAYLAGSWLLVQVADVVLPRYGIDEALITTLFTIMAIGFPIALIAAWVYELTPQGLRRDAAVDRNSTESRQTNRNLDRLIIVVLALALGFFAFDKFVLDPQREAVVEIQNAQAVAEAHQEGRSEALVGSYGDKSIAVLAFNDMSANGDQEYMSDGIAEELLNLLAKVPNLRVASRSSAFSFKGKSLGIPEIAKQLNVAHILEGSVRKSGNKIRITAQLIEAHSDTHLWSETYDRDLEDTFAIQDEVAASVVDELKIKLLGKPLKVRETNPLAYDLYLRAMFQIGWVNTEESHREAINLAEQALAIDETYVPARLLLSVAYGNSAEGGFDFIAPEEAIAKSREALQLAYKVEPDHPRVLAYMGIDLLVYDNDFQGAAEYISRGLQLDPTNWLLFEPVCELLQALGRYEEAVKAREYILKTEPLNQINKGNMILTYMVAGHYQEALAMIEADPKWAKNNGYVPRIPFLKLMSGDAQGALDLASTYENPWYEILTKTSAYHFLGRTSEFETALAEVLEIAEGNPEHAFNVAELYSLLGDADETFAWLERAYDQGNLYLMYSNPDFKEVHDDPRWIDLTSRLGMSKEQLDAVKFEVKIPD